MPRTSRAGLSVVIVGGGIGGLCAAVALIKKGISVTVCERASEFIDVGAGIQLSPNATRVLDAWGLGTLIRSIAFRPEAIEARSWLSGNLIGYVPLGEDVEKRFASSYLHIHRADLISAILDTLRNSSLVDLRLASPILRSCPSGNPWIDIKTGERISGDALVGADGIHSTIRACLFGKEAPRFTGNIAWRGLVPTKHFTDARRQPVISLWMGAGAHFVHYYVRRGEFVNFVGVVEAPNRRNESWTAHGLKSDLINDFGHWNPTVRDIVELTDEDGCFCWPLFDRNPLPAWSKGATTLLGDACHPTLPFMAQGACMAIEDAAVLGECLEGIEKYDIPSALKRYEALRKKRTAFIQTRSRRNARLYHMRPPFSWARDFVMRAGFGLDGQLKDIYSFDAFTSAKLAK